MWSNVSWGQRRTDLHQRAAAPLSGLQLAAGRSWSAAALVVTFNVRHGARLALGAQFGEPGGNVGALGAGGPVRFTAVTAGAAVVPVVTTDRLRNSKRNAKKQTNMWSSPLVCETGWTTYVWQRAAAPFLGLFHEAAGRISGAAGLAVAHVLGRPSWTGNSQNGLLLQGRDLLQPGQAEATGPLTSLFSHVTFVAFWAAVLMIATAHSLERSRWSGALIFPQIPVNVRFSSTDLWKVKECHVVLKYSCSSGFILQ